MDSTLASAPFPRSSNRHVSSVPTGKSMQVAKVKSPWKSSAATVAASREVA
jgi:hypothetical protein